MRFTRGILVAGVAWFAAGCMQFDYGITLVIDGVAIPDQEIIATPQTGRFVWRPSDTTIIPEWTPGIHTVWVRWDRISGLPDPGEWSWVFRVQ